MKYIKSLILIIGLTGVLALTNFNESDFIKCIEQNQSFFLE